MGETSIRVGDADRDEAQALLDIHLAEGRLTVAEHEERRTLAGAARVRADIEQLFDDLPAPHPELSALAGPRATQEGNDFWTGVGVLFLLAGLPTAIVLTVTRGWWWLIPVDVAAMIVAMILSDVADRRAAKDGETTARGSMLREIKD